MAQHNVQQIEKALYDRIAALVNGQPTEAVIGAAANIMINALRQTHPTVSQAKAAFAHIELLLTQQYDVNGLRAQALLLPVTRELLGPGH